MSSQSGLSALSGSSPLPAAVSVWKIYLNDQGRSIHTVKAFIADVNLLASYLPPDTSIGQITTNDLNNFLNWMQNERGVPCSPKTFARRITSLKSFFRWLQQHGAILVDPAEKVVQKSVTSPLPNVLSPQEVDLALSAAKRFWDAEDPDTRYYTLLRLLLDTGIKKGECLNLTTKHVDLETPNGPIIFVRYSNPKHRYKERKINVSDEWVDAYLEYKKHYDLKEKLFPWSPRRLEYLLEDIGKEAGFEEQLSFLTCRWTSALLDYTHGVEPNKIRQKLGVSEIQFREIRLKLRRLAGETSSEA